MSLESQTANRELRADRPVSLGELTSPARLVPADTPLADIDRTFRADRALRSLVVHDGDRYALLTREHVEYTLTGRLGYGRGLHVRSTAAQMVSGNAFSLPGNLELGHAARRILTLPEESRYRDVLVLTDSGPGVVSVSQLFERLSSDFRYAALHDSLTGLANRRQLEERGSTFTADDLAGVAVLFIDLDGFKAVNDTFGHRAGDEVLVGFADRLRGLMRPTDVLARLGGDEFAALLVNVTEEQALHVANRVVLQAAAPFTSDGHLLHLSASVGVSMAVDVVDELELSQLDALLRHADGAMIKAKKAGKRQVARLDGKGAAPITRNALIRRRLTAAFESETFTLHFQPQLDLVTGECTAVEALLRWHDRVLGEVSPAEFIPIFELSGDIHRIGEWVIDQACAQARRWLDAGEPRSIAINVSPLQLAARTVVPQVLAALAAHRVPAEFLQVEITEGSEITDLPRAIGQLQALRDAGLSIALDDYGTGYSSLAMLRDLPLTTVKIDKTFIDAIEDSPQDALLVGGVIDTAHALGLRVTAEGVERAGQLHLLRAMGCDTAQGYLISRPVPAQLLPAAQLFV
ncbi:putative bifunctional diguanylate cyclase/phosphodiesterase [Cryobacterium sp. W22_MBD10_FK3]|uniref:putative bifunctional diguanylate cyclase/phosphodiesterase n=1 Tax=Cryobacterium sp. W22_MBD10_FK3 TaxID=3240273 RepID=UPI003F908828